MGVEIERKFLVRGDTWRDGPPGVRYRQGYLSLAGPTVRVRVRGETGVLTIKARTGGLARLEYEYVIPVDEAEEMLARLCQGPVVDKVRYRREHEGHVWVIDEFAGDNAPLVMAEIELESEDEEFALPPWTGREVTGDRRYYNACLSVEPYGRWCGGEPEHGG